VGTRVARRYILKPKIPIWVNFVGSCNGRCWYTNVLYFTANWCVYMPIWSILGSFWYILPNFGMRYQEKSGNPGGTCCRSRRRCRRWTDWIRPGWLCRTTWTCPCGAPRVPTIVFYLFIYVCMYIQMWVDRCTKRLCMYTICMYICVQNIPRKIFKIELKVSERQNVECQFVEVAYCQSHKMYLHM
jgi:hypothetical protein